MNFGERLKQLRNSRGWTQSQFGEKINVTKASISGYENGTRSPDKETLVKIAEIFNVSVDYLLGRTDNPNPSTSDISDADLDDILDGVMSWNGEPLTEKDKEAVRIFLAGRKSK
ncbi:helix-turn-helix domain-containing protein [Enterococcus durans]|uniref:helix-turn-helix domain-containing protein n=1 Tax=Enterococcus durans TaxID=53345 RepID=UPI003BD4E241